MIKLGYYPNYLEASPQAPAYAEHFLKVISSAGTTPGAWRRTSSSSRRSPSDYQACGEAEGQDRHRELPDVLHRRRVVWMQMNYIRPIYEFKDRIFHARIKDAKILPDKLADVGILATPQEYFSPKLPGLGEVDWGKYFSALTDIGFRGAACVEVEDRSFEESFADRKASLIQSRNCLGV